MPDFTKQYPSPLNRDLLAEQLVAAGYGYQFRDADFTAFNVDSEANLDSLIAAHNGNTLTENQKIESARQAALVQARDYLRKQLLSPATIATIYGNVKGFVDGNTHLAAMMATRMTLANLAYGWVIADMNNPAAGAAGNANRARYLECVFGILAVLA